jgi:3-phosphoshikimate 1-carboxyvinyltransferase
MFVCRDGGRLPLGLRGGGLAGIDWRLRQPSAQVKYAILMAGLNATGTTRVVEPTPTRDHTERMLRAFGAHVEVAESAEGRVIALSGGQRLAGADLTVPGDPSSAAFAIVAATLIVGSELTIEGLMLNPLRSGLLDTLREMGADITVSAQREEGGESVGDVTVRHATLTGVTVPPDRAASMIDEYPILAVAAAFARGPTVMRGIGEMRVKESDRIAAMAAALGACGVEAVEEPEGLIVTGSADGRPPAGGGRVTTHGDHRTAMASLVLGLAARAPVEVDEAGMIATSFPEFASTMAALGADIRPS